MNQKQSCSFTISFDSKIVYYQCPKYFFQDTVWYTLYVLSHETSTSIVHKKEKEKPKRNFDITFFKHKSRYCFIYPLLTYTIDDITCCIGIMCFSLGIEFNVY